MKVMRMWSGCTVGRGHAPGAVAEGLTGTLAGASDCWCGCGGGISICSSVFSWIFQ